ncbi:metal-dependent transcriptional regulator [Lutibacter sp. A80]|uniref:metal-dependent transcriptional regulator n=1 Tax=Lutibacter sp. A80 TaxID=2918453 RepID=UPI001F051DD3|nr:metal-dependent transcriptional regulator [Lutibacter sp. A80]UMB59748.1 metal-dependent transcriptional regulator [Lutibacter sp. A80]
MKNSLSQTEENYLKAIYSLSFEKNKRASTNDIAKKLSTKASSVTDMIKKLSDKKLINYKKYQGANLTAEGRDIAVKIVRKHRLWEVFLVNNLNYAWDEVHDLAEQLEHVRSETLIDKLEQFLEFPSHDPHGDPIPDKDGKIHLRKTELLSAAKNNVLYTIANVKDNSKSFLQFLDKHFLAIGTELTIVDKFDFDESVTIKLHSGDFLTLSKKICANIFVTIK